MYKKRLIALLEGLECRNIDKLIEESPDVLYYVGEELTKYAKSAVIAIDALSGE